MDVLESSRTFIYVYVVQGWMRAEFHLLQPLPYVLEYLEYLDTYLKPTSKFISSPLPTPR